MLGKFSISLILNYMTVYFELFGRRGRILKLRPRPTMHYFFTLRILVAIMENLWGQVRVSVIGHDYGYNGTCAEWYFIQR